MVGVLFLLIDKNCDGTDEEDQIINDTIQDMFGVTVEELGDEGPPGVYAFLWSGSHQDQDQDRIFSL